MIVKSHLLFDMELSDCIFLKKIFERAVDIFLTGSLGLTEIIIMHLI